MSFLSRSFIFLCIMIVFRVIFCPGRCILKYSVDICERVSFAFFSKSHLWLFWERKRPKPFLSCFSSRNWGRKALNWARNKNLFYPCIHVGNTKKLFIRSYIWTWWSARVKLRNWGFYPKYWCSLYCTSWTLMQETFALGWHTFARKYWGWAARQEILRIYLGWADKNKKY